MRQLLLRLNASSPRFARRFTRSRSCLRQLLLCHPIEVPDGTRTMKVYWKAPVLPEMQLGTYNVRPIYRDPNVYRARKLFKNVRRDPDRQKFFANFFQKVLAVYGTILG